MLLRTRSVPAHSPLQRAACRAAFGVLPSFVGRCCRGGEDQIAPCPFAFSKARLSRCLRVPPFICWPPTRRGATAPTASSFHLLAEDVAVPALIAVLPGNADHQRTQ